MPNIYISLSLIIQSDNVGPSQGAEGTLLSGYPFLLRYTSIILSRFLICIEISHKKYVVERFLAGSHPSRRCVERVLCTKAVSGVGLEITHR